MCVCVHLQICVLLLRRAYTWCVCASVNAPRVGKYTVIYVFCAIQFHYLYVMQHSGRDRERERRFNNISDVKSSLLHVLV